MPMPTQPQSTVLIVDDTATVRETLESFLYPEGYQVLMAENAHQALNILQTERVDVILLDVMMPDIDGFTLCRQLKANPTWQHIPIIMVTALNSKQDLATGLNAGADEFLSKPVNGLELRARVRSMLRIKHQFDQLQRTITLRDDLSHMIVHDMRSPLMSIMGFSQLLLSHGELNPEELEDVQHIAKQAARLNSFVNDLLIIAKMEAGKFMINRSEVDLIQLIQKVKQSQDVIAASKKMTLVFDPPSSPLPPQSLDVNLIERVLDNLISNAIKYSPKKSTITLRLQVNPALQIEIFDEGFGIPLEHQATIFDKFEIVNLRNQGIAQTGLGLAFCKLVIEAHGGQISVRNNIPQGSIFTLKF